MLDDVYLTRVLCINTLTLLQNLTPMRTFYFLCLVFSLFCSVTTYAQSAEELTLQGKTHLEAGQHDAAIESLDKAISTDPSYAYAYFKRGVVKAAKQDDSGALADFNKAIELGFKEGKLYRFKGMSEHLTGNKDQACKDFTQAESLGDPLAADMKSKFCN